MPFKCTNCNRLLANRRRKTCEFCGTPIPQSIRLSGRQRAAIDKLKADEAKLHREFMERQWPGGGDPYGSSMGNYF